MRVDEVYISGVGRDLAPALPVSQAVEQGLIDATTAERSRMRSICISESSGPEMAVQAARRALRMADCDPHEVALVLHACSYYQGHDMWAPASYVQREVLAGGCPSMVVDQLSNGGLAALDLAVSYLQACEQRSSALITTGDRFCLPGVDRWRTDPGTVFGDGGTALLISSHTGFARIRSLITVSDAELETMGRGEAPFTPVSQAGQQPISIEDHRAHLIRQMGLSQVLERLYAGQQAAFEQALAEADLDAKDIAWFAVPHLGYPKMKLQLFSCLGLDVEQTTWGWGSGVGHLGAGDQFAGLDHLVRTGALRRGQFAMMLGSGGGFSWSAAVIEVLE